MSTGDYVSPDGEYIIPVTWEVYSTVKVKGAKNLREAIQIINQKLDELPATDGKYVDGSYRINLNDDEEAIVAQNYAHISDVTIDARIGKE